MSARSSQRVTRSMNSKIESEKKKEANEETEREAFRKELKEGRHKKHTWKVFNTQHESEDEKPVTYCSFLCMCGVLTAHFIFPTHLDREQLQLLALFIPNTVEADDFNLIKIVKQ